MTATDHPIPLTDLDWRRQLEKRLARVERRPTSSLSAVVTGEGAQAPVYDAQQNKVVDSPPLSSPTLNVVGDRTGMTVAATDGPIAPTTVLDYYLDDVLVNSTISRIFHWTTDSTGAPMVPETNYTWRVVARNSLGQALSSPPVTAQVDITVDDKLVRGWIGAGFILAGRIEVGNLSLDPIEGLKINLTDGGLIQFPATGAPATITAKVFARSLVVDENFRLRGQLNSIEGTLLLANGIVAPSVPPDVSTSWNHVGASLSVAVPSAGGNRNGLYWDSFNGGWVTTQTQSTIQAMLINSTTGATTTAATLPNGIEPRGGITQIGFTWHVLAFDRSEQTWWVIRYNSAWNEIGTRWKYDRAALGTTPTISTDGTFVKIARGTGTGRIEISEYTMTGSYLGTLTSPTNTIATTDNITGLYCGNADFGAFRYVVSTPSWNYVLDSAGSRWTSSEWPSAGGDRCLGMAWDGTRFHSLGSTGKVWHYSLVKIATSRAVAYTWYDPDPGGTGTHESPASVSVNTIQAARGYLGVTTAEPYDAGGLDDPKRVRIYIDDHRQAELLNGQTTAVYDVPDATGAPAPLTPYGGAITAGSLRSGASDSQGPLFNLDGTGPGTMGPLSWNAARRGFVLTSFMTAQSGWSVTVMQGEKFGNFCQWSANIQRTGAPITVPANGNMTNSIVAILDPGWVPAQTVPGTSVSTGRGAFFVLLDDGRVALTAISGTGDVATGDTLSLGGFYIAAVP